MDGGQRTHRSLDDDRLGVPQNTGAGCGIADVTDCPIPGEACENLRSKDIGNLAHTPLHAHAAAVPGDDSRTLLATMLLGVESKIGDVRRVLVPFDAKYAAHEVALSGHDLHPWGGLELTGYTNLGR